MRNCWFTSVTCFPFQYLSVIQWSNQHRSSTSRFLGSVMRGPTLVLFVPGPLWDKKVTKGRRLNTQRCQDQNDSLDSSVSGCFRWTCGHSEDFPQLGEIVFFFFFSDVFPSSLIQQHEVCWCSHMLHGAGIFTYIYPKNDPNVGKYSSTMEHMGFDPSNRSSFAQVSWPSRFPPEFMDWLMDDGFPGSWLLSVLFSNVETETNHRLVVVSIGFPNMTCDS